MITKGQARRIARTYAMVPGVIRQIDMSGIIPDLEWENYAEPIIVLADHFKDPQGVYADARAFADFCDANRRQYIRDWHDIREDDTVVPWAYKRGEGTQRLIHNLVKR